MAVARPEPPRQVEFTVGRLPTPYPRRFAQRPTGLYGKIGLMSPVSSHRATAAGRHVTGLAALGRPFISGNSCGDAGPMCLN